jgi:hypothetical protein
MHYLSTISCYNRLLYHFSRNIIAKDKKYIRTCQYDPKTDIYCPIFRLGKIVELAGSNISKMGVKVGGNQQRDDL